MDSQECRIEGCDRPVKVKSSQLCAMHYARVWRNGVPDAGAGWKARTNRLKEDRLSETERKCKACHEVKPVDEFYMVVKENGAFWRYAKCKDCHNQFMAAYRAKKKLDNPKPPKEKIDRGECVYEGCNRPAVTRLVGGPPGFHCPAHWQQWNTHKKLAPVGVRVDSYIDENVRVCTGCNNVKPQYDFYKRNKKTAAAAATEGLGRQSRCKDCMSKVSKFSAYMREGRYEDALASVNSMEEPLKSRYMKKYEEGINNG